MQADKEIETEWQTGFSYRAFPPNVKEIPQDFNDNARYPPVYQLPVQSAILSPSAGDTVSADEVSTWGLDMKGYAYAGAGRRIVRVDVSADAGENWHQAELVAGTNQKPGRAWAWVLWEATVSSTDLQQLVRGMATIVHAVALLFPEHLRFGRCKTSQRAERGQGR